MAGVSVNGFTNKSVDEIRTSLEARFKGRFGSLFDVSSRSPDGVLIGIVSDVLGDQWDLAEAAYNSYVPSKVEGVGLDYICELNDVSRIIDQPTIVTVLLDGDNNTIVPAGSVVATVDGVEFTTNVEVIIADNVENSVTATATVLGPIVIGPNEVTVVVTQIVGWLTSDNLEAGVTGITRETDPQLRNRRKAAVTTSGSGTFEATYSALADLNITFARILENDTNAPVGGIPAKAYHTIVAGGSTQEIAEAIFNNKPGGIQAFGAVTVSVTDKNGFPHDVSFSRPDGIPIFIKVVYEAFLGSSFDAPELIAQALFEHINLLTIGEDVLWADLFVPATQATPLISIKSIEVGTSIPNLDVIDIPIGDTEKATAILGDIDVGLAP
jgi:uncharacterized phage protein gp47/JayE